MAVTADLCTYSGLDRFRDAYPDRLFNVGIAEQNLVGVAAGMAKEGLVPFATTYGTFASARSLDQVRVSMGYMKLPVKLVGPDGGILERHLGRNAYELRRPCHHAFHTQSGRAFLQPIRPRR